MDPLPLLRDRSTNFNLFPMVKDTQLCHLMTSDPCLDMNTFILSSFFLLQIVIKELIDLTNLSNINPYDVKVAVSVVIA